MITQLRPTSISIHSFDRLDEQNGVGLGILDKHNQQFKRRLHDEAKLNPKPLLIPAAIQNGCWFTYATRQHTVKPLNRLVASNHTVHAVDKQHELPQGAQYIIDVVVFFRVVGHFDETFQAIFVDKLVHKVFVILDLGLIKPAKASK